VATDRNKPPTSRVGRILRTILWAILFAFVFGFTIGTFIRREIDQPVRYIGACQADASALATDPSDVGNALPCILVSGDHEEQVG
jgi:hypothetical protein